MTIAVWPVTLPDQLLQRGYSQSCKNVVLKSSMEIGPAKYRRRSTAGVQPVSGNLVIDKDQLADLREFYDDTLLGGSLRFSWKDPVSLAACEFRFTESPSWTINSGWYNAAIQLELLP